jgi:hypothetical protein
MKKVTLFTLIAIMVGSSLPAAQAHVSTQSLGFTTIAGQSSRVYLSLGHGCTYKNVKYGTSIFQVVVPAAAGKPTPEFKPGFKSTVIANTTLNAANAPIDYTVTWTSKSRINVIDDGTFFDFGLKVKWDATAQKIAFPTTQTCFAADKTPLYLKWIITDGTTKASTADTEFGPAPTLTTVAAAK